MRRSEQSERPSVDHDVVSRRRGLTFVTKTNSEEKVARMRRERQKEATGDEEDGEERTEEAVRGEQKEARVFISLGERAGGRALLVATHRQTKDCRLVALDAVLDHRVRESVVVYVSSVVGETIVWTERRAFGRRGVSQRWVDGVLSRLDLRQRVCTRDEYVL